MNPVELVQALPGVQLINNGGFSNGIDISVNGARPRANNYLIDGQDDNDNGIEGQALQANIPDMYSNVIALTNSYSAEYGRGGGAVVNLITKSGTNQFHGSAYELYSGSGLNAIDGQSRGAGITKTRFDQHQVAFTIGGPIIKNKLFAFGEAVHTFLWQGNAVKYISTDCSIPRNAPDHQYSQRAVAPSIHWTAQPIQFDRNIHYSDRGHQ